MTAGTKGQAWVQAVGYTALGVLQFLVVRGTPVNDLLVIVGAVWIVLGIAGWINVGYYWRRPDPPGGPFGRWDHD